MKIVVETFLSRRSQFVIAIPILWGFAIAIANAIQVAILASLVGVEDDANVAFDATTGWLPAELVATAIMAPILESGLMVALLSQLSGLRRPDYLVATGIALLAALLHLPIKSDDRYIGLIAVAFAMFSLYAVKRLRQASIMVVWAESSIIHVIYNSIGLILVWVFMNISSL